MRPEWLDHLLAGPADPEVMARIFPWAGRMIGCPHDAVYHAEGDPWTHTSLVAEALEAGDGFRELPEARRIALRLAAWFHDVAKPMTTVVEWDDHLGRERVRQPGHAPLGAKIAWSALVDAGYDPLAARDVHALVFWHQRPTHMPEQKNMLLRMIEFGHEVRDCCWDDLIRLCRADQAGRISLTRDGATENLDLLRLHFEEESANISGDLAREPWPFATDAARMRYLNGGESPWFTPQEPAGSRVVLMSGLPGSGKDTAIGRHYGDLPVISLDAIRKRMGIDPGDAQGAVLQAGLEQARRHLRKAEDFVWNSTGLTKLTRGKICRLVLDYDGSIEAVSLDVPLDIVRRRNREREASVPEAVIRELERKREPVTVSEAHLLWSIGADGERRPVFGKIAEPPQPASGPQP